MPIYYGGKKLQSLYYGGKKIASAWYGGKCVYRSSPFLSKPVQLWQWKASDPVFSVAVDSQFNAYAGDGTNYVTKLDNTGKLLWQWKASDAVSSVAVDSKFNFYAGDWANNVTKLQTAKQ